MAEAEFRVGDIVKHRIMKGRFVLLDSGFNDPKWLARGEDGELHHFYESEIVAVSPKRKLATASKG